MSNANVVDTKAGFGAILVKSRPQDEVRDLANPTVVQEIWAAAEEETRSERIKRRSTDQAGDPAAR